MSRGTNLPMVGDYNQAVLLDAIRLSRDGLSQVQLVKITGLSPQAVSNIVRRLIEIDLIRTDGVVVHGRGKPRTILRLNPAAKYAVGIHLDPAVVTLVVTNIEGAVVDTIRLEGALTSDPVSSVARVSESVHALIKRTSVDPALILGTGIAAPGPVDAKSGSLVEPPWLEGWDGFNVRGAMYDALAMPVLLDKDTMAAITGEIWARKQLDEKTLLFIYLGTGIGSAVAIGGEVMRGQSNNAGEIGHLVVDPAGEVCKCGRRGCLGRASDPAQLVREAMLAGVLAVCEKPLSPHVVDTLLTQLCDAANDGNAVALSLLKRSAEAVAEAVRMLTEIHDVNLVVFGGPFWKRLKKHYLPSTRENLAETPNVRLRVPSVEGTVMGEAVGAVGAASLVFDSAYSPRPSSFLLSG